MDNNQLTGLKIAHYIKVRQIAAEKAFPQSRQKSVLHHPFYLGSGLCRRSVCCSVGWPPLLLGVEEASWAPY